MIDKLTRVQLAACNPIVARLLPAQEIVEECKAHLALLLESWGIDFGACRVDFSTGEITNLVPDLPEISTPEELAEEIRRIPAAKEAEGQE